LDNVKRRRWLQERRHTVRVPRFALGVVSSVFRGLHLPLREVARRAAALQFSYMDLAPAEAHIVEPLELPVRERFSPAPRPGFTTAMPREPTTWSEAVEAFRDAPGCRMEPTALGILQSVEAVRAFVAEVPGLRITLDTGHVAAWGEDPADLIDLAESVQLRQARKGVPQARLTKGAVDFASFIDGLDRSGYRGGLSIEYFDLPDRQMPLDDPLGHALELADHVRSLL
jgi:sugar phosphate isomerase/epimerase